MTDDNLDYDPIKVALAEDGAPERSSLLPAKPDQLHWREYCDDPGSRSRAVFLLNRFATEDETAVQLNSSSTYARSWKIQDATLILNGVDWDAISRSGSWIAGLLTAVETQGRKNEAVRIAKARALHDEFLRKHHTLQTIQIGQPQS